MESIKEHLEATSDLDLPPSTWADVTSAADRISGEVFPEGVLVLRVVSATEIRSLNRRYRGVDAATDVLSFPRASCDDTRHVGDIALCWDAVERQACRNGHAPLAEAAALIAHGLLHLAGYQHETQVAESQMHEMARHLCKFADIEVDLFGH